VLVAAGAVIEGDLHTLEAVIAGQVKGAIHARERVELQATAMVAGDILTPRISIIEGGRVTGEVKMDSKTEAHVVGTSHNS
jgi:cytoskeletal protein CcmA (bactofilin family)